MSVPNVDIHDSQARWSAAPALGISFSVNVPGDRNIVFQTHVAQDINLAALNALLDTACAAADRLVAKYTLPLLKTQRKTEQGQLDRMTKDLERIDKMHSDAAANHVLTRRAPYKVDVKETQQREQVTLMIAAYQAKIAELDEAIAECEAKVNGADVRTDR